MPLFKNMGNITILSTTDMLLHQRVGDIAPKIAVVLVFQFQLFSVTKYFLIKGGSGHARHLQIVDQSVLPHEDCIKLCKSFKANIKYLINLIVESIKSPKNVSISQLCAGHKIVKRKPTKFYEYTGEHRQSNFTEIDPIKEGYRDKYHDKVAFTFYIP